MTSHGSALPCSTRCLIQTETLPIAPMSAMGLAALAASALAAAALRLVHTVDSSLMVLVWQFGSVVVLTLLEAPFGRLFLRWPTRQEVLTNVRRLPR
jgi:hypothetical protein